MGRVLSRTSFQRERPFGSEIIWKEFVTKTFGHSWFFCLGKRKNGADDPSSPGPNLKLTVITELDLKDYIKQRKIWLSFFVRKKNYTENLLKFPYTPGTFWYFSSLSRQSLISEKTRIRGKGVDYHIRKRDGVRETTLSDLWRDEGWEKYELREHKIKIKITVLIRP